MLASSSKNTLPFSFPECAFGGHDFCTISPGCRKYGVAGLDLSSGTTFSLSSSAFDPRLEANALKLEAVFAPTVLEPAARKAGVVMAILVLLMLSVADGAGVLGTTGVAGGWFVAIGESGRVLGVGAGEAVGVWPGIRDRSMA